MRLAIFDLDGTIIRGTSCEKLLFRKLFREGAIGRDQIWAYAGFLARWWTTLGPTAIKTNKSYLAGLRVEEVESAARDLAARTLPVYFNRQMLERVRRHLEAGDATALLTGAPQFLAGPVGLALGMGRVVGSRLAVSNGLFTGGMPLLHPFGREKARLALEICQELGCRLNEAVAYADSCHDLPLLEAVGQAVAVEPDRRLSILAKSRKWEIIA